MPNNKIFIHLLEDHTAQHEHKYTFTYDNKEFTFNTFWKKGDASRCDKHGALKEELSMYLLIEKGYSKSETKNILENLVIKEYMHMGSFFINTKHNHPHSSPLYIKKEWDKNGEMIPTYVDGVIV